MARDAPSGPTGARFERGWRRRFENYARVFEDDASVAGWTDTGLAARLRHFAAHWTPGRPGDLWVDAGCGAGTYTRYMAGAGMVVLGIDYSEPTLRKAAVRGGAFGWVSADVAGLPVKPGIAAGVVCFGVTQALWRSAPALRELSAVVAPDGEIWVDALNRWCLAHLVTEAMRRARRRPPHLRYESAGALRALVRASGFETVRVLWLPVLPRRLARWQWVLETRLVRGLLQAVPLAGALLAHSVVVHGRGRRHA